MIRRLLFFATFAFLTGIECAFFEVSVQWVDYRLRVAEIRAAEFKAFPESHPAQRYVNTVTDYGNGNVVWGYQALQPVTIGYQALSYSTTTVPFPLGIKSRHRSLRRRPR